LNGGFDWQYRKQTGVTLTLDPAENHDGHRALNIVFDGPGVVDAGISQIVSVHPNTTYDFPATTRTAILTERADRTLHCRIFVTEPRCSKAKCSKKHPIGSTSPARSLRAHKPT
jgi:hypothetical protein